MAGLPSRPPRPNSTNEILFEIMSEGNRRALAGFNGRHWGRKHHPKITNPSRASRPPRPPSTNEALFEIYRKATEEFLVGFTLRRHRGKHMGGTSVNQG